MSHHTQLSDRLSSSPLLGQSAMAMYSLVLAYGGGLWLHLLHEAEGATELNAPPGVIHWLRDSTLSLPLVVVGVVLACLLARRLLERYGDGASGLLVGAAVAAAVALYTSVVVAAGNPLHGLLFQAHEHANPDKELPVAIHMLKDSLLVLSANLVLAGGLVAIVAARAWVASQYRARRSFAARVSLAVGLVLLPSLVNGAAAIPVEAAIDPGNPCPTGAPARTFDVSAINVKIPLNRFGDNDPKGLMYTLTSHIGDANTVGSVRWEEAKQSTAIGLHSQVINGQQFEDAIQPLVLRANEGDCVTITFHNRINDNNTFGIHIDGLAYQVGSSGDAVGNNGASDVPNGGNATYVYYVPNDPDLEGAHHLHPGPSNRAATNHGLFGALVVEPVGSVYYKQNVNQNPDGTFAQVAQDSGWEAMIVPPGPAKAFRENVQAYHEIGNESEDVFDKNNNALPRVDPHTESYRPGARAMNYRSEPFMDRLNIAPEQESLAYASYTFADPATVTPHSYQRDPMKFRLIHAGSEVFHVFHLHGGGIRWRYNPKSDPTYNYGDTGLNKKPVVYSQSQRLDSQAFGPGESYNLEIEGGSGGVQQGAGEFLFHCHIVKHYVSGMWGFWRVFNDLQPDLAPLPDRATLGADLTNNMREVPAPVTSDQLIGKTFNQVDANGNVTSSVTITAANLRDWIEPQLPPQGKRTGFEDAQIWDWTRDPANSNLYLGEPDDPNTSNYPDTTFGVPGHPFSYKSDKYVGSIANRPAILFDPENGRYAWPLMRPHIGQRPPFAPMGHSGAPYLGENATDAAHHNLTDATKVDPYAGRADGLCPAGTNPRHYNVVAIQVNNQVTAAGATDPGGLIFSLAQDKANFQNGTTHPEPLAIRANIGDCVAITLTSEEQDPLFFGNHAKVNLHIHHVQFDTNSSDGVITGMSFEQSVRPYQAEDPQLAADAKVGDTSIKLSSVAKFHEEAFIGVGLGTENIEILKIKSIDSVNNVITFDNSFRNGVISGGCGATPNQTGAFIAPVGAMNGCPTAAAGSVAHPAGQWAGVEFVQERWYPDVALDNIFWHDHVDGIHGWGHGLVGMLNIEPTGATYHNPKTGALTDGAGTLSDIYADPTAQNHQLIPGFVDGSFREWSVWTIDSNPVTDSTINLTAEPWANRLNTAVPNQADPSLRFSSYVWGDPYTPMPRAYVGDPFVIRTINVSQRADTLHLDGHRFFYETRFTGNTGGYQASNPATYNNGNVAPGSAKPIASPYDTIHYGVSERFTFALDGGAGGLQKQAGDYLYMNGLDKRFRDGAWGIFRVFDPALGGVSDLVALPDRPAPPAGTQVLPTVTGNRPPAASSLGNPCPTGAPQHNFAISAVELPSNSNTGAGSDGRKSAFVLNSQVASVKNGGLFPDPLVMHVVEGQCISVTLTNQRPVARSSFHLGGLPRGTGSSGANIGFNPEQTVAPGQAMTYTFFADDKKVESAIISDFGGSIATPADGGFVEPSRDGSYGALIVSPPGATFTNSISGAPTDVGTQVDVHIAGQPSYRDYTVIQAEQDPLIGTDAMPYPPTMSGPSLINYRTADLQNKRQQGPGFFSSLKNGDPGTPILAAYKGDPMTIHVVGAPGSEQVKTGYLGGLQFPTDAFIPDSDHRDYKAVGPWEKFDAHILGGMGSGKLVGDMAYGTGRLAYTDGGMWGLLRSAFSGNTSGCRVFSNGQLAPKPLDGRCPTS
jgi:hypothetical protein